MPSKLRFVLPLGLALILPATALGQSAPSMSSDTETATVGAMPTRGMTMDQVKQHFGQPLKSYAPVGDPPISRWQYDGMTVYFENQYVIHSVATNNNDE